MNVARTLVPPLPLRSAACPPAAQLELLVAGDLLPPEATRHVEGCAHCAGYVKALQAEQEAFFKARPPELMARKLALREAPKPRARWPWALVLPALALLWGVPRLLSEPAWDDGVRVKGGSPWGVVYKREGMATPQPVSRDLRLQAGDALRFTFAAEQAGHLLILDLDGAGKVSAFYPFNGTRSEPVQTGGPRLLPGSVVLDDAPGPEWLVAVFSPSPLEVAPLAEQLRSLPPGASDVALSCGSCRVFALRVQKSP